MSGPELLVLENGNGNASGGSENYWAKPRNEDAEMGLDFGRMEK